MLIDACIKTIKPDKNGCLNWKWATGTNGYGRCWIQSKRKKVTVHRYILAKTLNLDYEDYSWIAMHICNNPSCVNIDHLMRGTEKLNSKHRDETAGYTFTGIINKHA